MEQRLNAYALGNKAMKSLHGIGQAIKASNLDEKLLHLVYFRVSQMNSCAFCLDMHSKDALAAGDTDQRLFVVSAWRETPFFTDEERAALAWAEVITKPESGISEDVYEEAKKYFSESALVDLTLSIIATNGYNRLNLAFGAPVGTYTVGSY